MVQTAAPEYLYAAADIAAADIAASVPVIVGRVPTISGGARGGGGARAP